METTENITSVELLPGKLYIAPEGVADEDVASDEYCAGATKGKVELCVRENVREIRDLDGSKVCDIRFGGRLELRGTLASVTPQALASLIGARRTASGRFEVGEKPAVRRMTVCLVCPVYGGTEDFTLLLRAAVRDGGALTLDPTGADGVSFTVVSENRFGKTSASLCFGERSAS